MDSFFYVESGYYEIGIPEDEIIKISELNSILKIKPQYFNASSPSYICYIKEFMISEQLVTFNEFSDFVLDTSYLTEAESEGWGWIWENGWKKIEGVSWQSPFMSKIDDVYRNGGYPVMQISWNDAVQYTKWKSEVNRIKYRLPYESEWEVFAKKAGFKSLRSRSNELTSVAKNSDEFFVKLLSGSIFQLGLLWEWTLDWYKGYKKSSENKDFGDIYKVLRGGSLLSEDIQRSSEFRFRRCPTARSPYYGMRIVKEV